VGAALSAGGVPDRGEYLARWSRLHGGASTGGLVGWWLGIAHAVARPIVRAGLGPWPVTAAGVLVAAATCWPASAGARWPVLAAVLAGASGLLDNLDGAVAVMSGRTSRWGFVLDSGCDRVADAAYCLALLLAGAPAWLAAAAAALAWLQEYVRARAAVAGMPEVGVVTVSERPTRVIVTAMFLLGAGVYPATGHLWAGAGAAAWTTLGAVGLGQLLVAAHRRLAAADRADAA
jgi:CDP-diacylglycerol--glycerol-3-phosphate 3-phosphatidyltransferase